MVAEAGRIVVVGSANTDMVVKGRNLPAPGETVTGGRFFMVPGGKGANQAVAAARLGAPVAFVAKVGDDLFGREAIEGYRCEGIDATHVLRDPHHATGVALILVDAAGENSISVAPGANFHLTPDEVEAALAAIGPARAVLLQLEIPMETVARAAQVASAAGATVILDPAPAQPLPDELLRCADILTPNASEAERLTGVRVADAASAREAARRLRAAGARNVVVTLGAQGCLVAAADAETLVPCPKVEPVDTTAAGDAFNGALACALAGGATLVEAARTACRAGALAVTKMGAQASLPTAEEARWLETH